MRPPRLPFVLAFLLMFAVGSGWAVFKGFSLLRSGSNPTRGVRSEKPVRKKIFPIPEEDPSTASMPLDALLDGLDFGHEEMSFRTFDVALQARLRKGEYKALDRYADRLLASKARFPGGAWKIKRVVEVLTACPGGEDRPDADWEAHLARFASWRDQLPDSAVAPVLHADALIGYAWKARGTGYASSVEDEGWRAFHARLDKSREILEAVPPARRRPIWYRTMQRVALGQGWDRADYDRLFDAAVGAEPRFEGFYVGKASFLMTRWFGEPGEWEAFAQQSADRLGGDEGDVLYYFILQDQVKYYSDEAFFADRSLSWPRMKRGFAASERLYGACPYNLNEFCHLAGRAKDLEEARALLDRIGTGWNQGYWGSKGAFEDYRDWVRKEGRYAPRARTGR